MKKKIIKQKEIEPAKKLTFKEKYELEELLPKIAEIEAEQEKINLFFTDVNFFKKNAKEIASVKDRAEFLTKEIKKLYERWEFLDALSKTGVTVNENMD